MAMDLAAMNTTAELDSENLNALIDTLVELIDHNNAVPLSKLIGYRYMLVLKKTLARNRRQLEGLSGREAAEKFISIGYRELTSSPTVNTRRRRNNTISEAGR